MSPPRYDTPCLSLPVRDAIVIEVKADGLSPREYCCIVREAVTVDLPYPDDLMDSALYWPPIPADEDAQFRARPKPTLYCFCSTSEDVLPPRVLKISSTGSLRNSICKVVNRVIPNTNLYRVTGYWP